MVSLKAKIQVLLKIILDFGLMVFLAGKHCSIVFGFPNGFWDSSRYREFSKFCLSRDLCCVFRMKDIVSGVLSRFMNW